MGAGYCICYTRIEDRIAHGMEKILHKEELEQVCVYRGRRKREYIAGRLSAKHAYLILTGKKKELTDIYIANDYLGVPYFMNARYSCSISHNREFAVGAVSDINMLRIGIDIQSRGSIKAQLIDYYINDSEKNLLSEWHADYDEDYLFTVVWCAKEAISKLLQYGFGLFGLLEVERITTIQGHLALFFKNIRNVCVRMEKIENSLVAVAAHIRFFDEITTGSTKFQKLEY